MSCAWSSSGLQKSGRISPHRYGCISIGRWRFRSRASVSHWSEFHWEYECIGERRTSGSRWRCCLQGSISAWCCWRSRWIQNRSTRHISSSGCRTLSFRQLGRCCCGGPIGCEAPSFVLNSRLLPTDMFPSTTYYEEPYLQIQGLLSGFIPVSSAVPVPESGGNILTD